MDVNWQCKELKVSTVALQWCDSLARTRGLTLSKNVLFKVDSVTASCYTTCEVDTPRKHVVVPEGWRFEQDAFKRWRHITSCWQEVRVGRGLTCPTGVLADVTGTPETWRWFTGEADKMKCRYRSFLKGKWMKSRREIKVDVKVWASGGAERNVV